MTRSTRKPLSRVHSILLSQVLNLPACQRATSAADGSEGPGAVARWIAEHSRAFIQIAGDDSVCLKCLEQGTRGPSHPGAASHAPTALPVRPWPSN